MQSTAIETEVESHDEDIHTGGLLFDVDRWWAHLMDLFSECDNYLVKTWSFSLVIWTTIFFDDDSKWTN